MFNLAKHRHHRRLRHHKTVSPDMYPAKVMHDKKQANRAASIKSDAGVIGKLVAQTGKSANDVMSGDKYWEYVWKFDEDYAKAVIRYAEHKVAPQAKDEAENPSMNAQYVPAVAPPKQQPGGGGGPLGAMGAAAGRQVRLADQSMYVKRDGPHRLMGTIVGRLLDGKFEYLNASGAACVLRIDREAMVSRMGSAAKEAMRLIEDMPADVTRAIGRALKAIGGDWLLSKTLASRYFSSGRFDPIPLVMATDGPVAALLMLEKASTEDPQSCKDVKEEIGGVMHNYVSRLKSALAIEGIEVEERRVNHDSVENDPPHVLSADEVDDSLDAQSLIMTAACQTAPADLKIAAANRLVMVMCRFPEEYDPHKLSAREADELAAGRPGLGRMRDFAKLYEADDAAIMEAYFGMGGDDRLLVSHLVSSQDRRLIIDSVPEMCLQRTANGEVVNDMFLDKVDLRLDHAKSFVRGLMSRLAAGGEVRALEKVLLRKMMQAVDGSPDDEMISMALRSTQDFLFPLRALALCKLGDDSESVLEALRAKKVGPATDKALSCPVAAITCAAIGSTPELMRAAWESGIRPRPADVVAYGGRKAAMAYMSANRIGWDGEPVPRASEIISAPDDPLPLAKSLAAIGDLESMMILLRACAKRAKRGEGRAMFYPMSFMADALRAHGKDADVLLDGMKVEINDDRMIARRRRRPMAASLPGATMTGANGVYEVRTGSSSMRFAASGSDAIGVGLLLSQGKAPLAP